MKKTIILAALTVFSLTATAQKKDTAVVHKIDTVYVALIQSFDTLKASFTYAAGNRVKFEDKGFAIFSGYKTQNGEWAKQPGLYALLDRRKRLVAIGVGNVTINNR